MNAAVHDCWNRIGAAGDQSCPELPQFVHCRNCPVFASAAHAFFDRPAPEGYLAEWAALLGGGTAAAAAARDADTLSLSLLIFRLHADWLALSVRVVVEVTPVRPVHRIPHRTGAVLSGLANLRGQLHLAVSLHGLLDAAAPSAGAAPHGTAPRMVVIRQGAEPWVFTADEVLGIHRVPRAALRPAPATLADPAVSFSQAVFAWGDRSVGLLDDQRVFAALRSVGP